VAEAGLAGEGEEPSDALLGAGVGEDAPDVGGERAWPAESGEGVGAGADAVPDADAGLAGCGGEGLDGGAGLGGDVDTPDARDASCREPENLSGLSWSAGRS
jgi:hypothetical protein